MQIKKGIDNKYYAVFHDEDAAYKYYWFWGTLFKRPIVCFGQYMNAYYLF